MPLLLPELLTKEALDHIPQPDQILKPDLTELDQVRLRLEILFRLDPQPSQPQPPTPERQIVPAQEPPAQQPNQPNPSR